MLGIDLAGKKALVTGGSRGVGAAAARLLAWAGADVGISYRSRSAEADALVEELSGVGVHAWAHPGDLSDPEAVRALFDRARQAFGALDILVASAGVWPPEDVPIARMSDAQWRRTMGVNLDGVFYCVREAAGMIREGGRIVLVGSTAGQRGEAFHGDYAASKGALGSLVKGVAGELAPRDVTVNCVAPGWIDTEMAAGPYAGGGRERIEATIPLGRVASAEDVAGPIVFLCSPLGRHITGEVLNVNGGAVLCG
ncbi:MAG TPA: SDR family oxidoreductase [Longimicrobiales bacterium]|nr:SDR family oxidoreductase [Longimicrobiales bacterium]